MAATIIMNPIEYFREIAIMILSCEILKRYFEFINTAA
jgi:hypothetical protein